MTPYSHALGVVRDGVCRSCHYHHHRNRPVVNRRRSRNTVELTKVVALLPLMGAHFEMLSKFFLVAMFGIVRLTDDLASADTSRYGSRDTCKFSRGIIKHDGTIIIEVLHDMNDW